MTYPEKVPAKFKKDGKKIQGVDEKTNQIEIGLSAVEIIVPKKTSKPTIFLQNTFAQLECDDETNGDPTDYDNSNGNPTCDRTNEDPAGTTIAECAEEGSGAEMQVVRKKRKHRRRESVQYRQYKVPLNPLQNKPPVTSRGPPGSQTGQGLLPDNRQRNSLLILMRRQAQYEHVRLLRRLLPRRRRRQDQRQQAAHHHLWPCRQRTKREQLAAALWP